MPPPPLILDTLTCNKHRFFRGFLTRSQVASRALAGSWSLKRMPQVLAMTPPSPLPTPTPFFKHISPKTPPAPTRSFPATTVSYSFLLIVPVAAGDMRAKYDLTSASKHIVLKETDEARTILQLAEDSADDAAVNSRSKRHEKRKRKRQDLMLPHKSVSKKHAVLQFDQKGK